MIRAKFTQSGGRFTSFSVSGHAGFDEYGKDIVCASVTSAVQLTANAVTEVLKIPARLKVDENKIELQLPDGPSGQAEVFLEALALHIRLLAEDYEGTIKVSVTESKPV